MDITKLLAIPVTEDRSEFIGASTYDDPERALLAAAHGVDADGNPRTFGADLEAKRKLAAALIPLYPNIDPRLLFAELAVNNVTTDPTAWNSRKVGDLAGITFEEHLAWKKKFAKRDLETGSGPGRVAPPPFPGR